jgi:hypothetical protein
MAKKIKTLQRCRTSQRFITYSMYFLTYIVLSGNKLSVFAEEGTRLVEEIVRNVFIFFRESRAEDIIDSTLLLSILQANATKLFALIPEKQNLSNKALDINQVPIDEVNEVTKSVNSNLFNELSILQRQKLFINKVEEGLIYIKEKIAIIFSKLFLTNRYY